MTAYQLDAARWTLRERQRDGGATWSTRKLIARLEAQVGAHDARVAAARAAAHIDIFG